MTIYMISYDLIKRKNYEPLWTALKEHGAHRALESLWLVSLSNTTTEVFNWLKGFVDSDDRLFVIPVNAKSAFYVNAKAGTKQWIIDNS